MGHLTTCWKVICKVTHYMLFGSLFSASKWGIAWYFTSDYSKSRGQLKEKITVFSNCQILIWNIVGKPIEINHWRWNNKFCEGQFDIQFFHRLPGKELW